MDPISKQEIETLNREQLVELLSDAASDMLLRWIIMDAVVSPLRTCFARTFGKCDTGKCHKMALYSGNASKGGQPCRCAEHKDPNDTGVPFAAMLEALAAGMGDFE